MAPIRRPFHSTHCLRPAFARLGHPQPCVGLRSSTFSLQMDRLDTSSLPKLTNTSLFLCKHQMYYRIKYGLPRLAITISEVDPIAPLLSDDCEGLPNWRLFNWVDVLMVCAVMALIIILKSRNRNEMISLE